MTEELTLEQVRRQGRAVDFQKLLPGPPRVFMNQLCNHFLAGAAIAQNQHVDIEIRKQFNLAMDFQHLRRRSQKETAATKSSR